MSEHDHPRIYLSSPHMGDHERTFVTEAFDTNWIAPLGPNVDGFEREFAAYVGTSNAAAVISGTAALHLALVLEGVGPGDEVWVSSMTFVASVNPILYQGATPVLFDSERASWNIDPDLVVAELEGRAAAGKKLPKVLVVVHLYGQSADLDPLVEACQRFGVTVIEDAAEALGSTYRGRAPGTFGRMGFYSFNGNKIITTSGGGMLVSEDADLIAHSRKLATQARDPAPHYQHTEIGFNYRMSNIVAGIGRGQLLVLDERVSQRRAVFQRYVDALSDLPGLEFAPEAPWGTHTRWLTCITVDPAAFGATRDDIREALAAQNIEARPIWKPMHMQPLYAGAEMIGGEVCEELFELGLCLPSGSNMPPEQQDRVIRHLREVCPAAG